MKKPDRVEKQVRKIYNPPLYATQTVMESEPYYMVPCPKCERRTLDVFEMPERLIHLRYKCPHCKSIVVMPLIGAVDRDVAIGS